MLLKNQANIKCVYAFRVFPTLEHCAMVRDNFLMGVTVLSKKEIHIIINLKLQHNTLDLVLVITSAGAKNFPLKNQIMVSLFYLPIKKGKIFDEKSNYIPVRTFSINGRPNRLSLDFYCEKIF